jgi:hypothetical protein
VICSVCGNYNPAEARACLRCGRAVPDMAGLPPAQPTVSPAVRIYPLTALANVLTTFFAITAALLTFGAAAHAAPPAPVSGLSVRGGLLALAVAALMLATTVLFLNWFYRARKNAGLSAWPQRWSPGWAIGSWFLPPVLLWFPYQIMADIWRAGRPAGQRQGASNAMLPGLWWTCWVLAWITAYQHTTQTTSNGTSSSYALNFGGTRLSAAFAAAAAITLIVIIRKVSAGPVGHPPIPAAGRPIPQESG